MSQAIKLVAGLGNPGERYETTRHNAGFWFLDQVVARDGGQFRPESRFQGDTAEVQIRGHRVRLLKPTTHMNRSGLSVAALARFFRIEPAQILVVHDEIDLPVGAARLKTGGGPGGHNGLKDIIAHLGDRGFHRLRLGVGHPGERSQVINYVLRRPGAAEQKLIDEAVYDSLREFDGIVEGDLMVVMNRLHARKLPGDKPLAAEPSKATAAASKTD
jgi:peptidyl-tRNA hydrolase, PTH1 family